MTAARALYLHGFASGPGSKKARLFRDRFAERGVRLEIPDLAAGDFEHLTITGQLAAVERELRGEPAWLMGSSLGGYLAALYAARHPEIERVVLMAPAFGFAGRFLEAIGPAQAEDWERTGWLSLFHYGLGGESRVGWELIEDARRYEDYPAVTQPALVFHGVQDATVPAALSQEFARRTPAVRLELLESDHELLNAVDRIWTATLEFLGLGS